jgi:hypothetical protein
MIAGGSEPDIATIRLAAASPEAVACAARRVAAVQAGWWEAREAEPFLIVTPLGLARSEQIARMLAELGIRAARRATITDWATAATPIYVRTLDDERLRVALAFEAIWRMIAPGQPAELWAVADWEGFARLAAAKNAIRARLGILRFRIHLPGITIRTPDQIVRLQPLHVPDPAALIREAHILNHILADAAPDPTSPR